MHHELGETTKYEQACERLLELEPDDPDALVSIAYIHTTHLRLITARDLFNRWLALWPEDERAGEVRTLLRAIESDIAEHTERTGLTDEQHQRAMGLHERALEQVTRGRYREARQLEEQSLHRAPGLIPALNTLSSIDLLEGHLPNTIAKTRRVLEDAPQNFHGIANMVRYLVLSGEFARAAEFAERLRPVTSVSSDAWLRKAEAFSFLGDFASVWTAYEEGAAAGFTRSEFASAYGLHLAGVAAWRLGREAEARKLWQRALKADPNFELTLRNLDDLKLPVGERNGPWPFSFDYWVTPGFMADIRKMTATADVARSGAVADAVQDSDAGQDSDEVGPVDDFEPSAAQEEATPAALQTFAGAHPELPNVVLALLDRGDPIGREFAVRIAGPIGSTEIAAALRDFALGQSGSDQLRMDATRLPLEVGLLPAFQPIRLWSAGQWRELLLMNMEITFEPIGELPPEVEEPLRESVLAMRDNDAAKALPLLERARQLGPDIPSVLNNLASAYGALGRNDEAKALSIEVHHRFPDYFFGRVTMARMAIQDGDLEAAKDILQPLLGRRKLHIDEFGALADTEIRLSQALDEHQAAESWLKIRSSASASPSVSSWTRSSCARCSSPHSPCSSVAGTGGPPRCRGPTQHRPPDRLASRWDRLPVRPKRSPKEACHDSH